MNFSKKFEKLNINQTILATKEHNLDFFLCNFDGKYGILLYGGRDYYEIKSSRYVDVEILKSNDEYVLRLLLLDVKYYDIFIKLIEFLISNSREYDPITGFAKVIKDYKRWRGLLRSNFTQKMTLEEQKGLVAELFFLKNYMLSKYGDYESVESWIGPLMNTQDFVIHDTWYEVKYKPENSSVITISSINQLDVEKEGKLSVVTIKKSTSTANDSYNLNQLVKSIESEINDELIEKYTDLLIEYGYAPNEDYNTNYYSLKEIDLYTVKDGFPRIVSKDLIDGVVGIKYDIDLNFIEEHRSNE
ncbi:PD-(D/E)XK motif protein [Mycoplasmatota bacterium zrk1]